MSAEKDLVRATVDREAQRCGIRRQRLAGLLLEAGWTPERFLAKAQEKPNWEELLLPKATSPNSWDRVVEAIRARPETYPAARDYPPPMVDDYHDFSNIDDEYSAAYDTQLQGANLPDRDDDTVDTRLFYAWQQWRQMLKEHAERVGHRLSRRAFARARDAYAEILVKQHGRSAYSEHWIKRHYAWHKERGTDPR